MDKRTLKNRIIAKAWADEDFKRRLLANPVETLRAEGAAIPDGTSVNVVENTESSVTLVLPRRPQGELSEGELAGSVGGVDALCVDDVPD
ncbi:MAG TPA: NHLP leader peptide family RiPP precursor [Candidatus Baltobacteraceae bacterium]|nr:NHLP leader peptide family RiPP precursor [Candidatus Baltobacteraceae bacterium]